MSRNRQRAKQRQAERRAARLDSLHPDGTPREDTAEEREAFEEEADLASGAPSTHLGGSGNTLEHSPHAPHIGDEEQIEEDLELEEELEEEFDETEGEEFDEVEFEARLDELDGDAPEGVSRPKGKRRDPAEPHGRRRHNRLIGFLIAVWAELQRVEWPDRQTLTMLTGVVLLFVIVMGAYLGLLDAVFSKLINKIL
jgi:preprotein translocase SecE subunit